MGGKEKGRGGHRKGGQGREGNEMEGRTRGAVQFLASRRRRRSYTTA